MAFPVSSASPGREGDDLELHQLLLGAGILNGRQASRPIHRVGHLFHLTGPDIPPNGPRSRGITRIELNIAGARGFSL